MHLFTKPISGITFSDVKTLVGFELTESTRHDYKADFPPDGSKLAATVASMANTMGGVTLVGVEQPLGGKPTIIGVVGPAEKLQERAGQILLRHIHPTPLYEIGVVEIPIGEPAAGRFVVIIRTHESRSAPHAMVEDAAIYTRTGDLKTPHRYADLRWLEHLLRRRAEPEELRRRLLAEFEAQFHARAEKVVAPGTPVNARMVVAFGRTYPHEMLVSERHTLELVRKHFTKDRVVAAPGGVFRELANAGQLDFFRAHSVGLFLRGVTVPPSTALTFNFLTTCLATTYVRSAAVLSAMGWWGSVRVAARIERRSGTVLNDMGGGPALVDVADAGAELVMAEAFEGTGIARLWGVVEQLAWGMGKEAPPMPTEWPQTVLAARANG